MLEKVNIAGCQWFTPIILATQGAESRRIAVQSQPRQIVHETRSQKSPSQKRTGGVALSSNPRTAKKEKVMCLI
jgi:hypothetical protein